MTLSTQKLRELRHAQVGPTGNRVAKAIELAGLTQVDVSKGTGLPYTYVSDVSRGRFQTITVENASKFARFFECAIEDLFPAREAVA